jgi:hypothetical protein
MNSPFCSLIWRAPAAAFLLLLGLGSGLLQAQIWQAVPMAGGVTSIRGAAFARGRFVLIADERVHYSDDGDTWTASSFVAPGLGDLRLIGDRFFARAGDSLFASDNGVIWSAAGTLPRRPGVEESFLWASDGTGGVVARSRMVVGPDSVSSRVDVLASPDLMHWDNAGELPAAQAALSVAVQSLVHGGGRWVINYLVATSAGSGVTTSSITAVSADRGRTWVQAELPADNTALEIAYGNGVFLAVSRGGGVYRSEDGFQFRVTNADVTEGLAPTVRFAGGLFIRHRTAAPAGLYGSVAGVFWRQLGTLPITTSSGLAGITYGRGRFLATGMALASGAVRPYLLSSSQAVPPIVLRQPFAQSLAAGRRLRLAVAVEAPLSATYRWMKDRQILPGENSATLTIAQVNPANAGSYRCLITNALGTVSSDPVDVAVVAPAAGGRLTNLSANLPVAARQSVQVGFVLAGEAAKPVTVRAIGPTLAQFEVPDPMSDPKLVLRRNQTVLAANDNWQGQDGASVGGFPLPAGSRDAVVAVTLQPGAHTAVIDNADATGGRLLTEIYDGETADGLNRLGNLSVLAPVSGNRSMVVGFVIGGQTSLPVVIRGVGPSLAAHGVSDPLANPRIRLFRGPDVIAANDNWLEDDGRGAGAFPLPGGSPDAVLTVRLAPGAYTVELSSAILDRSGTALLEVYDAL